MPRGRGETLPSDRLPDPSSVLAEFTLTARRGIGLAPTARGIGPHYRIIRTTEVDEYDPPVSASEISAMRAPLALPTDNKFRGTARKAAKLSIAHADREAFDDVKKLISTFAPHETMANHPDISTDKANNRVAEERRNVKVAAFLYAASREDDNDYHLIVGRNPSKSPKYMTVEISGLPSSGSGHFSKLKKARDSYFAFFGDGLPGATYDFYDPPIPVEIEGSLFFDMSHATGSRPGPTKLRPKMPVVWEIHPVTAIVFEPS